MDVAIAPLGLAESPRVAYRCDALSSRIFRGGDMSRRTAAIAILVMLAGAPASAQTDWESVEITSTKLADGLYMLQGAGGNIGLSIGADGSFLIDDQFAPLSAKITAAIGALTDRPVRFVLNTHWHGDHTGGNENFGEGGAYIVAHDNVYRRLNPESFRDLVGSSRQAPDAALPVMTFSSGLTFHWNGEDIEAVHVPHAHTDGDAVIYLRRANVFHMGDTFFNRRYPFIDVDSGGGINGVIHAAERVLAMADSEAQIIPGHGALAAPEDLRAYRDMLIAVRDRIQIMVNDGKTLEEVIASAPTSDFDEVWMQDNPEWRDRFIGLAFRSVGGGA